MKLVVALKNGEVIEVSKLRNEELLKGQTFPEFMELVKKFNGKPLGTEKSFELCKTNPDFLEKIMKPFWIWTGDTLEKGVSCKDKFGKEEWSEGAYLGDWVYNDLVASVGSNWDGGEGCFGASAYGPSDGSSDGLVVFFMPVGRIKSDKFTAKETEYILNLLSKKGFKRNSNMEGKLYQKVGKILLSNKSEKYHQQEYLHGFVVGQKSILKHFRTLIKNMEARR